MVKSVSLLSLFCICLLIAAIVFSNHSNAQNIKSNERNSKETSDSSQPDVELFSFVQGKKNNNSPSSLAAQQEQFIAFNLDALTSESTKTLRLSLLDGKTYGAVQAESEGLVRRADDDYTWRGKVKGDDDWTGDVILTVKGRAVSGLIYAPSGTYEIIPQKDFTHLLVELDSSRFPECGGVLTPPDQGEKAVAEKNQFSKNTPDEKSLSDNRLQTTHKTDLSGANPTVENGSQIDVMITYTAAVRSALGGATQVQAFAQQSVAVANTAYQNSAIITRLRLVQTMEVGYADNGDLKSALDWVTADATVAAARNTAKADLVSIIIENATDSCGYAWVMQRVGASFASHGFSAIQRSCSVGNLSYAHEVGHNQGADHNPENGNQASSLAFPYAFGHWDSAGNFRTVMSYSNPCPSCRRVAYFSNPSVNYNGLATGTSSQRNNALVINNTANTISNFTQAGGTNTSNKKQFDFDGDGKSDAGVFRPSNGVWYLLNSQAGFFAAQFGISTDTPVAAHYDGDNKTDPAVFRDGTWYLQKSAEGFSSVQFGAVGDIPAPADFDGDGKSELAVYRPSNGTWYVLNLANNNFNAVQFGISTDKPVVADYDGDKRADYAVYRPSNGTWYLQQSTAGFSAIQFGISIDKPVVGDYDGDGKADAAVYRPSSGVWYLLKSSQGFASLQFGNPTDVPSPADYDGDGKTDAAVFRDGTWYLQKSTEGFLAVQFGSPNDKPVSNSYIP